MEEHQLKCEQSGRFVEAEMAKQKVIQFKRLEEEKKILELKKFHDEQKGKIEIEYKEELDIFNEDWDYRFAELNEKYENIQKNLNERFQKDIEDQLAEIELKSPKEA